MIAPSQASAPELQKKTCSANVSRVSFSADRLLAFDTIEVRGVPKLLGLSLQGRDELRMRMAESVDGDAGAEIEDTARPSSLSQPATLAAHEDDVLTGIRAHHSRRRPRPVSEAATGSFPQRRRGRDMVRG